jgi:transposase
MNWIEGWDRKQQHLLPETIEEYVGAENPVRFVDAFVEGLDLRQAGFVFPKENAEGRGRPSYPPKDLLKLYLYGYLHQSRSSRRLEAECHRNLEVIWLMRKLAPDHKTIADFRKDNALAFKAVVREFAGLCRQMGLFGGEFLAIDGTKVKAQNAADRNWSQSKLAKHLGQVEARLEEYLQALDRADESEGPRAVAQPSAEQLQAKIQRLRERRSEIEQRLQGLQESGQSQLSATDADSRSMKSKGRHVVGYNVQAAVDAKHHLLVVSQVNNMASDQGQLAAVAQAAKAELQMERGEVVADGGYYKHEDIKTCQEMGLEVHLPAVENSPSERAGLYGKADFIYDAQQNEYRCPAGARLKFQRCQEDKGRKVYHYQNRKACLGCALKLRCTGSKYRTVSRWEHEACVERMLEQMARAPEKLPLRKTLIEHCWATFKWLLPGGFLVRGLRKVGAEVSLAHFGYNFKRVLAVKGLKELLAALQRWQAGKRGGVFAASSGHQNSYGPGGVITSWFVCFCRSSFRDRRQTGIEGVLSRA